jgi:hypothetical protein
MGQNGQEKQVEQMWHAQARKKAQAAHRFFLSFFLLHFGWWIGEEKGGGDRAGAPAIFLLFACRFFFFCHVSVCVCV